MTNEILFRFGLLTSLVALGASAAGNDRDAHGGDVTTVIDQNSLPQFEAVGYADFDGHGLMEVLIRDTSTGNLYIGDVIQFANGDITAFRRLPYHDPNASYINLGDFNGDGKVDLLIHNDYENSARLVLYGDRNILSVGPSIALAFPFGDRLIGRGRFNGDNIDDLIWFDPVSGQHSIWLMYGARQPEVLRLTTDPGEEVVAIGDLNGDHLTDLLVRHNAFGRFSTWFLQPDGRHIHHQIDPIFTHHLHTIGIADFNGDGRNEILFEQNQNLEVSADFHGGRVQHYTLSFRTSVLHDEGYVDDINREVVAMAGGSNALSVMNVEAIGDFNGDGRDDVYVTADRR